MSEYIKAMSRQDYINLMLKSGYSLLQVIVMANMIYK